MDLYCNEMYLTVKKKPTLFFLASVLQILVLVLFTLNVYAAMLPAVDNAQSAFTYLSSVQAGSGQLGDDPLALYENYKAIFFFMKIFGLVFLGIFLFINSSVWAVVH